MSNFLANKKTVSDDRVESDFLGGGFSVPETDIYPFLVKYAYFRQSQTSDAVSVNLSLEINGREHHYVLWVTTAKGDIICKNSKTGKPMNILGYTKINSLTMLLLSKELGDVDTEDKILNLYNFEEGKETPQNVECLIDLHGLRGNVALQKQIVNKEKKNDKGIYVPTGETREVSEIIKFFAEDKLATLSEVTNFIRDMVRQKDEKAEGPNMNQEELDAAAEKAFQATLNKGQMGLAISKMGDAAGKYAATWLERNKGETYDRSTSGSSAPVISTASKDPVTTISSAEAEASLFDD